MTELTPTATAEFQRRGDVAVIAVSTTWSGEGLDRTEGTGFVFDIAKTALAARLVRAINAGVVFANPEVKVDINGHTYVGAESMVLARMANADLRRLGY